MTTAAPDAFLDMFRNHPQLLPAAPDPLTPDLVKARIGEHLPCQRCGNPSAAAIATCTDEDGRKVLRWLDLCEPCAVWMVVGTKYPVARGSTGGAQ